MLYLYLIIVTTRGYGRHGCPHFQERCSGGGGELVTLEMDIDKRWQEAKEGSPDP